ncbi:MAG: DUF1569 domain-containing protein [Holophagaceae bacterium]
MPTLFAPADRAALLARLDALQPTSPRQWGTMTPAQALAHCAVPLEAAAGLRPMKQKLLGKLLAWLVKRRVLGEAPFRREAPTDPDFVVKDDRDLDTERARVKAALAALIDRGPAQAGTVEHAFFGRLSGDAWGVLMAKHLDHHLRQFGA